MIKYNIITKEREFIQVNGEAIVIDGLEEFQFFWHTDTVFSSPTSTGGDFEEVKISELTTGACVGHGFNLDDAIKKATENICSAGIKKFKKMLAAVLKITGKLAN